MTFNIGINVVETNGTASPAIAGAPTSVAGLVLRSRRGPKESDPIRVSNSRQFQARFGGFDPRFIGAYCVNGLFQNGGREAYVARVLGSGSSAASRELLDRDGNPTLNATAGYRGTPEDGLWGNDEFTDIVDNPDAETALSSDVFSTGNRPARFLGEPLRSRIDLSPLPGNVARTLTFQSGESLIPVIFSQLPFPEKSTVQDILDVINTQAENSILATAQSTAQGERILLTSRQKGESPPITIADSTYEQTLNDLGFPRNSRESQPVTAAQPAQLEGEPISQSETVSLADLTLVLSVSGTDDLTVDLNAAIPDAAQATPLDFITAITSQADIDEVLTAELVTDLENDQQARIIITSVAAGSDVEISIDINDENGVTNDEVLSSLGFPAPNRTARGGDATPASLRGEPISPSETVSLADLTLVLSVSGNDNFTIDLNAAITDAAQATPQDFLDAITSQADIDEVLNAELVPESENDQQASIVITSVATGSDTEITIDIRDGNGVTNDEALSSLGFPAPNRTARGGDATPASLRGQPISQSETISFAHHTLVLSVSGTDDITIDLNAAIPNAEQATPQAFIAAIFSQVGIDGGLNAELVPELESDQQARIVITSVATGSDVEISIDINDENGFTNNEALGRLGFPAANRTARGIESSSEQRLIGGALSEENIEQWVLNRNLNRVLTLGINESASPLALNLTSISTEGTEDIAEAIVSVINEQAGISITAEAVDSRIQLTSTSPFTIIGDNTPTLLGFTDEVGELLEGAPGSNAEDEIPPDTLTVPVDSINEFEAGQWVRLSDQITEDWFQIASEGVNSVASTITLLIPEDSSLNEYRVSDGARLATGEFNLLVHQLGPTDPAPQLVETWESLTLDRDRDNYAVDLINDPNSGSSYIVLENLNDPPFSGNQTPVSGRFRLGEDEESAGNDGDEPSTGDYQAALNRFDPIAIQLLSVLATLPSEPMLSAVTRAALDYCEGRGDCMFVGHTTRNVDVGGARAFGRGLRGAKLYGALYWPWIKITDPIGRGSNPIREVPPTGHILGVYARIEQTRGVWKAVAGDEARLLGAVDVSKQTTDVDHTDLVKNGSVNGVRSIPGAGIVIDSSRTLSTDTRWLYVNVRLLFNYVKSSLKEGLRWVKQEPNRENLWNKIKYNTVTPFLQRLYQAGAFGPGTPEEVFTVICGPENNPPDQIQIGNLKVEVYFNPGRPAETIIIFAGQQASGSFASEQ